jgi:hypothetical protein
MTLSGPRDPVVGHGGTIAAGLGEIGQAILRAGGRLFERASR